MSSLPHALPIPPVGTEHLDVAVCVAGGGPAGSSVARRLAQLGHSVLVVEKRVFPRPHIGESLTAGVLPLLDVLGVRGPIERAGFLRPEGTILSWPPSHGYRAFSSAPGFQVDRGRFDAVLLRAAEESGARVLQGARLVRVEQNANGGYHVAISWNGRRLEAKGCFLVDASGRRGALGGRKRRYGASTLALWAYWKGCPPSTETCVEAGEQEWFWGAPLPDGTFNATVFVDFDRYQREARQHGGREGLYRNLLRRSQFLAPCLDAVSAGPVTASDATCYYDEEPVTRELIRVGEASFSVDPLSSQGVQLAIGSGLHAAALIHTVLRRPSDRNIAEQFYRERQRDAVAFHKSGAANLYSQVAAHREEVFWHSRAGEGANSTGEYKSANHGPLASGLKIRVASEARISATPSLDGEFVVLSRAVFHPRLDRPVVFLGGVAVASLLERLLTPLTVTQTLSAWSQQVPRDRAETVLSWLWDRGVIEPAE